MNAIVLAVIFLTIDRQSPVQPDFPFTGDRRPPMIEQKFDLIFAYKRGPLLPNFDIL